MQQKILNNRYELEQKIGEGGMARVYRGRDTRLNRRIAVKVLHSHYASDAGFLQRFHHEAQAAANLRHPNIVDVYDVGLDGDIHYIVMEYVEGSDLKALIARNGPLPVDQAVQIAEAVANGLSAAHRIGLVHRDIKPQNIIVGPAGQVKITDFGIAKSNLSTAMTETGVTFGTADYISPEQARGQPATPRSDIYSLGVTLYEMLTGRLPFTGDNAISVAMQHVSEEPPPPRMYNPRIPPQLEMLVLRALSKDPQDRPATAQEFARLLSGWRDIGEQATVVRPVAPRPAPPPRPALRPVQPMTSTSSRMNLPPVRPAVVVQAPPENRGLGFGGFFLALMLLAGVIGLVYLGTTGFFNDLVNFTPSAAPPPPTAIIEQQTAEAPTVMPLATVPDLAGKTSPEAAAAVQAAHLTPREAESRFNDVISTGLVIDQFPPANTSITETSVVTYAVSLGPESVEVPDVTGLSAASAQSELERAGFQVKVEQEASQTMSEGFVIRSEPRPPARPPHGDTITIFVSIGNKVVMPDVTGLSENEAKQRISAAGLVWSFSDYQGRDKLGDRFDQLAPGTVVSSIPRGNDLVPRGTPVTLGVRAP
jgi:serine/threonine protein kinase/beta-lactam-binding protein with PASTA domain